MGTYFRVLLRGAALDSDLSPFKGLGEMMPKVLWETNLRAEI
jgi:DNA gyrase/topoisomerase IV subunit B